MIRIFIAPTATEAYLVQGLLQSSGIKAEVRGESLTSVEGASVVSQMCPSVWVPEDDQAQQAKEIVARYGSSAATPDDRPAWRCTGCGELHEPQFSHCWQCGAARPEPPC